MLLIYLLIYLLADEFLLTWQFYGITLAKWSFDEKA